MEFTEDFINDITLINAANNANDENFNLPLQELQHNIQFLSKLITVSSINAKSLLFNKTIDEFILDTDSPPILTELQFSTSTGAPSGYIPRTNVYAFDPLFDRKMSFTMPVDGPNPGNGFVGVSYFVNEDDFSGPITCGTSGTTGTSGNPDGICGYVKFAVYVAIVNPGEFGNPSDMNFTKYTYAVPVPIYMISGKLGYFEVCGDFYADLQSNPGALAYFIIAREGSDTIVDTFTGNFLLASLKTGIVSCFNNCSNIEEITC